MQTLKTFLVLALVGAGAGAVVSTLVAPNVIAWYQTPGTAIAALCPCADLARQITTQLVHAQLGGAAAGVVVFVLVGALMRSRRRRKLADSTAASRPAS
jgi:hypothetical protein